VLTVEDQPVSVERRLAAGGLRCPGCGGPLARWGFAVARTVRGMGGVVVRRRPRRARCRGCGITHVLLPVIALSRRADLAEVIGAALAAKAAGAGHRRIAARLARPAETVRGWLRRFAVLASGWRALFTGVLVEAGIDPVLPAPAGSGFADAVAVIVVAASASARRWPVLGSVSPWVFASAVTGGALLAPPR
jgi:hypothetical protein